MSDLVGNPEDRFSRVEAHFSIILHCYPINSPFSNLVTYEPRREKTGLRGFRPGPTQTGLYKLRKELEA